MKIIIMIGDGMADVPVDALGNLTPLQVATTPNMDFLAREGRTGRARTVPHDMSPGSDVANLSIMGYDPRKYYSGRAPFEAAAMGIELARGEIAFRCNFVTVSDGIMIDYSAGHISNNEGKELINALKPLVPAQRLYAGVSYRNIVVLNAGAGAICIPPHDITNRPIKDYLPKGSDSDILRELMEASKPILDTHPVNQKRTAEKKRPANLIWLWGQGPAPSMPTFKEKYNLEGAVVSAVDLLKGIGVYAGLDVIKVPEATGTIDTNYAGKVHAAFEALRHVDVVFLHVEAPDEAAHEGDVEFKIKAIELFDKLIVGPIICGFREMGNNWRICVLPDHPTPISIRTHTKDPVPFAIMGTGIEPDNIKTFDEEAVKLGSYGLIDATHLMDILPN
ncbi:MAG: cofactor-independent phosphoglycerate mutase [Methanotrichaceae archaeon]|nr:cofactor-independent phosphoglycerate mutase [Methanotrichaceae archaeon]